MRLTGSDDIQEKFSRQEGFPKFAFFFSMMMTNGSSACSSRVVTSSKVLTLCRGWILSATGMVRICGSSVLKNSMTKLLSDV